MTHFNSNIDDLNYKFINPIKFFINKVWNNNIINNEKKGLNRLNSEFNNNLEIKLNLDNNLVYSGTFTDNLFNEQNFGLLSLNKIKKINFDDDNIKYNLSKTLINKSILLENKKYNEINKLKSINLYNYILSIEDETLFPFKKLDYVTTSYKIDILDKKYRNNDPIIKNLNISIDTIEFEIDSLIKNVEDVSILATEEYTIKRFTDYSNFTKIKLKNDFNLSSSNSDLSETVFYYNEIEVKLVSFDKTNKTMELAGKSFNLNNCNFLKIVKTVGLINYKIVDDFTILKLSNINDFYNNELNKVYININNIIYLLKYNNSQSYYFIETDLSDGTKTKNLFHFINKIYKIFRFDEIKSILSSGDKIADITLDRKIDNYMYYNQIDSKLPFNFTNSLVTIKKVDFILENKVRITYVGNIDNIINTKIKHNYRIKESIDYSIKKIKKMDKYLYNISNIYDIQSTENIEIKIKNYNTSFYNINSNLIKFYVNNSSYISTELLNKSEIEIFNNKFKILQNDISNFTLNNSIITIEIILPNDFIYTDANDISNMIYLYEIKINHNDTSKNNPLIFKDLKIFVSKTNNILKGTFSINSSIDKNNIIYIDIIPIIKKITYNISNDVIDNETWKILKINNIITPFNLLKRINYNYNLIIKRDGTQLTNKIINFIKSNNYINLYLNDTYFYNKKDELIIEENINFSINRENNNSLYQITTNNNIMNLNKSNTFIPQIKILDNLFNEFSTKYEYSFNFYEEKSKTINFKNELYISYNNKLINSKIVFLNKEDFGLYYYNYKLKISTNDILEINKLISFYLIDFSYNKNIILLKSNYLYNTTEFVKYINNTTINILNDNDTIDEYDDITDETYTNVLLKFKFSNIKLTNNSYNLVGFHKVPDIVSKETIVSKTFNDPIWIDNFGYKFFKNIEFFIDNIKIEKQDFNSFNLIYNTEKDKLKNFSNLIKLKKQDQFYFFDLPLYFFYKNSPLKYLPVCNLSNSIINIIFNIDKLSNLITNYGDLTKNISPILSINYTTIFLSKNIIKNLNKEKYFIANSYYYYSNFILNNLQENNNLNINFLVKNIYFIIDNSESNIGTTTERDMWFSEYYTSYQNYLNKIYDSNKNIFIEIDYEISINSNRIMYIKKNSYLSKFDMKFILFLDKKYLAYINENLNTITNNYSQKIVLLIFYFKNIYKNISTKNKFDLLDNISLKINGVDLLPTLPSSYLNVVLPYKMNQVLPENFYMYPFCLNLKSSQPTGHLNFKKLNNFQILTKLKSIDGLIRLKIYTNEYRIYNLKNNKIHYEY